MEYVSVEHKLNWNILWLTEKQYVQEKSNRVKPVSIYYYLLKFNEEFRKI